MAIALSETQESKVRDLVESGVFASPGEAIDAALAMLQFPPGVDSTKLEKELLRGLDSPVTAFSVADFDNMRERLRGDKLS